MDNALDGRLRRLEAAMAGQREALDGQAAQLVSAIVLALIKGGGRAA